MTSQARIFLAGVGTTVVILAIGFGGGVLLATSALPDNGSTVRRNQQISQTTVPATRVVYPASSEPVAQVTADIPKPQLPSMQPLDQGLSVPGSWQAQPEHQKTRRELRAEKRKERAERRAERHASRYHWQVLHQQEPAITAFGNE